MCLILYHTYTLTQWVHCKFVGDVKQKVKLLLIRGLRGALEPFPAVERRAPDQTADSDKYRIC
ncbi:dihydropyrimidine dehydrogenase (NADP+) [Sarotherodon galilaeus]